MRGKNKKFAVSCLVLLIFILGADFVSARTLEINYPPLPTLFNAEPPQVFMEKIEKGEIPKEQALPLYVKYFYGLILMVSGLIALGAIVYGGFQYLTSAGAPGKMSEAREWISGAILGLVILLSANIILTLINPQLAILSILVPGLEKCSECDCDAPSLSDYCIVCCTRFKPPQKEVDEYLEIPVGRIIERVILKSYEAKQVAEKTKAKAEELKQATARLETYLNECNCSASQTQCDPASCTGTSCANPRPCPHWDEIRALLDTTCTAPTGEQEPITQENFPYGCFYYFGNAYDPEGMCACMGRIKDDGSRECYGEHGGCCPSHADRPICGWEDCQVGGDRCPVVPDHQCGGLWLIGEPDSRPVCALGTIPKLINELHYWRTKSIEAKQALENEYVNLRVAEDLLRDTASPAFSFEQFAALDEKEIKKLKSWQSINIDQDPLKDIRNQISPNDLGMPGYNGSEDPTTFYITVKGNEDIINKADFLSRPLPVPPYYPFPGTPPAPPGSDPPYPPVTGDCSIANMTIFENEGAMASCVCQGESGGNAYSLNDCCLGPEYWTSCSFNKVTCDHSVGLFQLNMLAHCDEGLDFTGCSVCNSGIPCCSIINEEKNEACKLELGYGLPEVNISWAYELFLKRGWSPWSTAPLCEARVPPPDLPEGFLRVNCTELNPAANPDLNPKIVGYSLSPGTAKDLFIGGGEIDSGAPRLQGLLGYTPSEFVNVYKLNGFTPTKPWHDVQFVGIPANPGDSVRVPDAPGYNLSGGYEVVVVYADADSITIKYTEDDNIIYGYAIHVLDINTNQSILEKYQQTVNCTDGERTLVALKIGDVLGTAKSNKVIVEARDTGDWMDARYTDHWWQ